MTAKKSGITAITKPKTMSGFNDKKIFNFIRL
jgi:hypothetical protein